MNVVALRPIKKTKEPEPFLSVDELADLIPFAPFTIRKWCRENKIPYRLLRGRYLFRYSEVAAFIDNPRRRRKK